MGVVYEPPSAVPMPVGAGRRRARHRESVTVGRARLQTVWRAPTRWVARGVGERVRVATHAMDQKSPTRLVLICGLPASGKTTLARQLAVTMPATRLDKDQWTTHLGHDVWDDEFRVRLERQLWALAQELLAQGQSVILEWGHWARVERDEKRLRARALGVGVELHHLDAPLEELIDRAQRRNASGEWSASPMTRAHFERWATIFQPPDEEELLLFDEPVTEA